MMQIIVAVERERAPVEVDEKRHGVGIGLVVTGRQKE